MRARLVVLLLGTLVPALTGGSVGIRRASAEPAGASKRPAPPTNRLTAAEKKAGWRLLFDGKTTRGWRGFKQTSFPTGGWQVVDGTLRLAPRAKDGPRPGDIVTEEAFESFELRLEFRLSEGGNSGLKYLVDESLVKEGRSGLGFEFQMLDDDRHPDAKKGKDGNRTVGALYDLIAPAADKVVHPPGQWNEARLVVDGDRVEHWLNGKMVVSFQRGSAALKTLIADSKYKTIAGFGEATRGHLLLQDHEDEVAFRNIKLRTIDKKTAAR
jgi:hypothetical protein